MIGPYFNELWCNGNTADFGSVILGSSPGSSTNLNTIGHIAQSLIVDDYEVYEK